MTDQTVDIGKPAAKTVTVWLPAGTATEPGPDRRRWNSLMDGVPPWTRNVVWAQQHPGVTVELCVTNRPAGIAYRLKRRQYEVVKEGEYTVKQRSVGDGFSAIFLRCDVPPDGAK